MRCLIIRKQTNEMIYLIAQSLHVWKCVCAGLMIQDVSCKSYRLAYLCIFFFSLSLPFVYIYYSLFIYLLICVFILKPMFQLSFASLCFSSSFSLFVQLFFLYLICSGTKISLLSWSCNDHVWRRNKKSGLKKSCRFVRNYKLVSLT